MSDIIIKDLNVSFGDKTVFSDFNLTIPEGKITAVLGNSGTGKTTLLNAIAGTIGSRGNISGVSEDIAYIFQNPILVPNLTVFGNISYILKHLIKDKEERKAKIHEVLKTVDLFDSADLYPKELSSGMAQRVSMARAFARGAGLILMDEPFKGLDIGLKARLSEYFLKLWKKEAQTVVFVTHSIEEALFLSDNIVVINGKPAAVSAAYTLDSEKETRTIRDEKLSAIYAEVRSLFCT